MCGGLWARLQQPAVIGLLLLSAEVCTMAAASACLQQARNVVEIDESATGTRDGNDRGLPPPAPPLPLQ
jgi:hypothetical protein